LRVGERGDDGVKRDAYAGRAKLAGKELSSGGNTPVLWDVALLSFITL